MVRYRLSALLALGGAVLAPSAYGQSATVPTSADTSFLRLAERLESLGSMHVRPPAMVLPAISLSIPTAYGSSQGNVGIGVGIRHYTGRSVRTDGAVGAGLGLGNVGFANLDIGVAILDLKSQYNEGGFGQRGSFNAKLHRSVDDRTAVAVGIENVLNWGGTDAPVSTYLAVTRRARLREAGAAFDVLHLTAGFGHGRFVRESRALRGEAGFGVFGSAALRIASPVEVFAEWTGQDLGVGLSLTPFRSVPLVITPTFQDFPGSDSRFLLGAGIGFSLH